MFQVWSQFAAAEKREDLGWRYIVHTNFSCSALFELSYDNVINVGDLIRRDVIATPDRPIGNLFTLLIGLAVLPTNEHKVDLPQEPLLHAPLDPAHPPPPSPPERQGVHQDPGRRPPGQDGAGGGDGAPGMAENFGARGWAARDDGHQDDIDHDGQKNLGAQARVSM